MDVGLPEQFHRLQVLSLKGNMTKRNSIDIHIQHKNRLSEVYLQLHARLGIQGHEQVLLSSVFRDEPFKNIFGDA